MKQESSINPESTQFGERDVSPEEKTAAVRGVFDSVADNYDVMNDLMSGGVHRLWKNHLIRKIRPKAGLSYLDVAGGTGDIAFRIKKAIMHKGGTIKDSDIPPRSAAYGYNDLKSTPQARKRATADLNNTPQAHKRATVDKAQNNDIASQLCVDAQGETQITLCDLNYDMLRVGRDRAVDHGWLNDFTWVTGNAESLPALSNSVDVYTIAFGLRNVTRIDDALKEALRVLKPGGRFFCLEFSHVENPLIRAAYDGFSYNIIPKIGHAVAKDRDSYQYLVESIRKFPKQRALTARMKAAGFQKCRFENLSFGIAAIHSGIKT
jgi:ubiquinone/menaquinone biosynthesis methyltransferase